jgi:signal transduction histidine kinase
LRDPSGETYGAMAFIRDIGSRKSRETELERYREGLESLVEQRTAELESANEELRVASEAKSAFLASMSHELRTPLNSIIGFSQIMRDEIPGPINQEQAAQLDMVLNSSRHLLELINDVLDLSKIEAGRATENPENTTAREIVGPVRETVRPMAEQSGLELRVRGELATSLRTDVSKVRQILLNFLTNAVKYTDEGRVQLAVERDDRNARFVVSDTGCGISDEELPHITEDFYRARNPRTGAPQGSGLGLAISRRLARQLGGTLEVESTVGEGSTFTLTLPRELRVKGESDDGDA